MEWVIISRPPLAKPNEPPRGRARRTGLTQIPVSKDRRGRARRTRPLEPTDFPDRLSGVPRRRAQRGQGPGARFEPSAPWAEMSVVGVRRGKAAFFSGCKSHPAIAPAGSNRSSHGGDEMAEALG